MTDLLTWRDNTPVSTQFDDVYFSTNDGLAESRYVFIEQNNLSERWQQLTQSHFCIVETGFGTGLNFLATWQHWREHASAYQCLEFISIEKYPLKAAQIQTAISHWPELAKELRGLLEQLPPRINGWHKLSFDNDRVRLTLIYDDIRSALTQLSETSTQVDAIYLDGFAPDKNPDMWADDVLAMLPANCAPKATLSSFTAVGRVRRSLEAQGFNITKVKGFGRKREMITGCITQIPNKAPAWYQQKKTTDDPQRVAIIGAGIAGSIMAYKLAKQGLTVDVYEQADAIASAASGNPQGILFLRLSASEGFLADFSLSSYLQATRFYRSLLAQGIMQAKDLEFCGMLQLNDSETLKKLASRYESVPELVQFVDQDEASHIAGTRVNDGALWFKNGAWINPPALCKALLSHPKINLHTETSIIDLKPLGHGEGWQLLSQQQSYKADAVVICNAIDSPALMPNYKAPLKAAPGQITLFKAQEAHDQVNCVVCHKGYIAPPYLGKVNIGASFRMTDASLETWPEDDAQNLARYHDALPELPLPTAFTSRVAIRAASKDYLPLAGAIPETAAFSKSFAALSKDAKANIDAYGEYLPNLYTLSGLGSRGLSYAPLCADMICQQITDQPNIYPPDWQRNLNPARFLIRALKRNTVDALL